MGFFYERHVEPTEPRWGSVAMRLRWVFKKTMTGGLVARARVFWHSVIRGNVYESCDRCGRPVGLVWSAPKSLWLEINGRDGGLLCIPCFDREVFAHGHHIAWVPIRQDQMTREGGHP